MGALYCPNACGHHQHHDDSMNQLYTNHQKLFFVTEADERCLFREVQVTKCTWDDVKWSYDLAYTNNLVNTHFGLRENTEVQTQAQLESRTAKSCGQGQDE